MPAALLLAASFAVAAGARGYAGLSVAMEDEIPALPGKGSWSKGARVVFLTPGAAAEAAGFEVGDVILEMDGRSFDDEEDPAKEFRARLKDRRPGENVPFLVLRRSVFTEVVRDGAFLADPLPVVSEFQAALDDLPVGGRLEVRASRDPRILRFDVELGIHPHDVPSGRPSAPDPDFPCCSDLESWGRLAVAHFGLEEDMADLEGRLARLHLSDDGFRRVEVRAIHRNPWKVGEISLATLDRLAPGTPGSGISGGDWMPLPRGLDAEGHADALQDALEVTAGLVEAAFQSLGAEEREALATDWPGIGKAMQEEGIYLHADSNRLRRRKNLAVMEAARRVDREALARAAASWQRLADPAWLASLRRDLEADPRAGETWILRRETPLGEIVIGGRGPNRYRGFEPAVVIDLGGDDIYSGNAGSSAGASRPAAAVIDLGGDDAYESTSDGAQAAGILGVGLLVDVAGDDRYISLDWSQGVGLLGHGTLLDLGGDDIYRSHHMAQGVGLWGEGALLDIGGDDRYELLLYGQGLGLPGGTGLLHDGGGDDHYYAKGEFPTNYGTQGVFDAWAQGTGLGFRMLQSGGIGLLADDGGADVYEAGNFSQGGGYYFGWGLLRDGGRASDTYIGSRYNQGFCAHQAAGTFLDEGGDDTYLTRNGVIAGLAWDQCVTWFRDASGDDFYRGGSFSLGASAHNSFCFFEDLDGSDRYQGPAPARAGGNDYHGGSSLSIFLDLGRGRDRYDNGLEERAIRRRGEHGIAADLPGRLRRHLHPIAFERFLRPPAED